MTVHQNIPDNQGKLRQKPELFILPHPSTPHPCPSPRRRRGRTFIVGIGVWTEPLDYFMGNRTPKCYENISQVQVPPLF
jgi:hypothetical protein